MRAPPPSAGRQAAARVLVVDDDDVDRERLLRLLRRYGAPLCITEAASKAAALAALAQGNFDFVFLDFNLADGDGRELVPQIQSLTEHPCLIVAITGAGNEQVAASAIKSGIHEYLPKHALTAPRLYQALDDGQRYLAVQARLREAEQLLHRRSLYDLLTDLPNRNLFFDRLEQACLAHTRHRQPFAVMMIDLDRFKEVNDTLGHAAGDQVLQQVAKRLLAACRGSDTISRLGGDEFAAICAGVDSAEAASVVAEKLVSSMRLPIIIDGRALSVGISVGIALCPAHDQAPGTLMSVADKAMYLAKTGLMKVVCAPSAGDGPQRELPPQALLTEIERAIDKREFFMFYQPKINLTTHKILGVEALMRWRTAGGVIREPSHFIPVVEQSSILPEFTRMSIDLVLAQLAAWIGRGIPMEVAVNISSRMLEDPNLAKNLLERLRKHKIPPAFLTLEITETAIIQNPEAAREVVRQITALGVNLSIDDFGSGFTSFTYLKEFSIPEIKIDKNFIIGLKPKSFGASMVKCVSAFCRVRGYPRGRGRGGRPGKLVAAARTRL